MQGFAERQLMYEEATLARQGRLRASRASAGHVRDVPRGYQRGLPDGPISRWVPPRGKEKQKGREASRDTILGSFGGSSVATRVFSTVRYIRTVYGTAVIQ